MPLDNYPDGVTAQSVDAPWNHEPSYIRRVRAEQVRADAWTHREHPTPTPSEIVLRVKEHSATRETLLDTIAAIEATFGNPLPVVEL